MTDRPYTDADLRAEAARQHALSTAKPDEGLVGEVMESGNVPSLGEGDDARTWTELLEPDGDETPEYAKAQRAVTDLIRSAADVSDWAINLGADGLEPHETTLHLDATPEGKPRVVVLFAFADGLPEETRRAYIDGVHHAHREGL